MAHNIHDHRILILDFGSQYTQLIARRVREIGVYCEIKAFDITDEELKEFNPKGIILAGGPNFPNAARDELGVLGTEIENQNTVVVDVMGHEILGAERKNAAHWVSRARIDSGQPIR
jgi:GMP synthase-like glutamine amidotransferase